MITASKSALATALKLGSKIIERRNTIPILSNVGFQRGPAGLQLRMTDLDIEGIIDCPADLDMEFHPFTIPAEMLKQIVSKLPEGAEIKIKLDAGKTQALLSSGRSRFQLQMLPIGDLPTIDHFPERVTPETCTTLARDLHASLAGVAFAISTEETRYYLNGVFIHPGADGALLVATDGHRLAKHWLRIEGSAPPEIIVPRKTVEVLMQALPDLPKDAQVKVEATDAKIALTMPGLKLVSKLIDGTFPNYKAVIPAPGAPTAEFEGKSIKPAIERVTTIVTERGKAVKFAIADGQMMMTVNNPDAGSAEETITVQGDLQIEAGFNGKYVFDAVSKLSEGTLTFAMQDPGSPATLRTDGDHEENLIVLMPMRV